MKKIILIFAVLTVVLSSCRKDFTEKEEQIQSKTMVDLTIDDNFSWKTTKDIEVSISSSSNETVIIKSQSGYVYLKAFLTSRQEFTSKITVPTYVSDVIVVCKGQNRQVTVVNNKLEEYFN